MTVLYAKPCAERRPEYRQATLILEENGRKYARKTALCPEAEAHVNAYAERTEMLERALRPGGRVKIVPCVLKGEGAAEFPFVEGEPLTPRLQGLSPEQYGGELTRLQQTLEEAFGTVPFRRTEEYRARFGDAALAEGVPCLTVSDLDLNFDNIFPGTDGSITLIDCEWTAEYPVPLSYLLFRPLLPDAAFAAFDEEGKKRVREAIGLTEADWETCWEMERAFQKSIARDEDKLDYFLEKGRIEGAGRTVLDPDAAVRAGKELQEMTGRYEGLARRWYVRIMRRLERRP